MSTLKTEHTPGPWKVASLYDGPFKAKCVHCGGSIEDQPGYVEIHGDGFGIAQVRWLDKSEKSQHLANARLIAAAPDLLAACKKLLAWSNGQECSGQQLNDNNEAKAIIARAEGKEAA